MKKLKSVLIALYIIIISAFMAQSQQIGSGQPYAMILGTLQDAGAPHINCRLECCRGLRDHPDSTLMVTSIGIVDPADKKCWIIEATPDMPAQLKLLQEASSFKSNDIPDGIFLTHAHIGHYSGLMYLGREAAGTNNVPVYAMPRMKKFLETNGPWSQLVELKNIALNEMKDENPVLLNEHITITPFLVPHRDEYSETVGYKITGPEKTLLFIPDIDKWSRWKKNIVVEVSKVDYALVDATFYDDKELNRDMSEIPHPFVAETMALFESAPAKERAKICLIHFNHTNPLLRGNSEKVKEVQKAGYRVARQGMIFGL